MILVETCPYIVFISRFNTVRCFTISMLMMVLASCGGQPHTSRSSSSETLLKIGPSETYGSAELEEAESGLSQLIQGAGKARANEHTRGVNDEEARALVLEGRALMKKRELDKALALYKRAQKIYPEEDHLFLIAATRHLQFKRDGKGEQCQHALVDWQLYLKNCDRCKSVTRYHDQAVINANTLGEHCGAWTVWESEPRRAKLSIDQNYVGRTPQSLWMPIGKHKYELRRADLIDRGEIALSLGQSRTFKLHLTQEGSKTPFMIAAQLKCKRGKTEQAQPHRCAGSLITGDLFTVELVSDQDIFVYLFGLSDQELVSIYPSATSRSQGAIPGGQPIVLPQNNAWVVDGQSQEDELWLLASEAPLSLTSSQERTGMGTLDLVREIAKTSPQSEEGDLLKMNSSEGYAFLRWVIRTPSKDKL